MTKCKKRGGSLGDNGLKMWGFFAGTWCITKYRVLPFPMGEKETTRIEKKGTQGCNQEVFSYLQSERFQVGSDVSVIVRLCVRVGTFLLHAFMLCEIRLMSMF